MSSPHPSWIVLRSSTQVACYVETLGHVLVAIRHHLKPQNLEVGI